MSGAIEASGHVPVLLDEVIGVLAPRDGEVFIDGTFGAGGYSKAILAAPDTHVIGIDRDPDAIAAAAPLVAASGGRLEVVQGRFSNLDAIAAECGHRFVDGVVLDIGVSSMQLDQPGRGFSFMADGPLDMRMEQDGPSAADLVNTLDAEELAGILYRYGEERASRRIARAIVEARAEKPLTRTLELAGIVTRVLPPQRFGEKHPATRTFQALRIAVNDELGEIERALAAAERCLKPGGRLAIVTFHSLEDRIVKQFLAERTGRSGAGSRHLPQVAGPAPSFRRVSGDNQTAGEAERQANPRARSARLRAAERTQTAAFVERREGRGKAGKRR
ncbi:MAG: 16S rRNA (cytosine(1402)-N(4))-methyltransferase RsmH [Rhodobiaceae bacterium]|nr:16S rRNA (cytosine(1402)-N(4))-methyltransferase RsmH [Rhodobiaceae bacterium]MCC0040850.1 16S rRNA (cytosine(1402)-N(4))-methyltransferase RsmH [Rhodobiaceae bacterium]